MQHPASPSLVHPSSAALSQAHTTLLHGNAHRKNNEMCLEDGNEQIPETHRYVCGIDSLVFLCVAFPCAELSSRETSQEFMCTSVSMYFSLFALIT